MLLKLKTGQLNKASPGVIDDQIDYDYLEKETLKIFIYGYPRDTLNHHWVTASNIYENYQQKGLDFIHDIDGIYSIVIIEKNKCYVIVDRYGIYTLFYRHTLEYWLLSDTLDEILNVSGYPEINESFVIEYMNFGFKLGNKTEFKDIYEFEAGKIYIIDNQLNMTKKTYWAYRDPARIMKIDYEAFRTVFNTSLVNGTQNDKKIVLPLTGGLDTRTILSAILPNSAKLHCYTHGFEHSRDVKVAKRLSKYLNIHHTTYTPPKDWIQTLPKYMKNHCDVFRGLTPFLPFAHVFRSYILADGGNHIFLSGILGNELWRGLHVDLQHYQKSNDLPAAILSLFHSDKTSNNLYNHFNNDSIHNYLKNTIIEVLGDQKNIHDNIGLFEIFIFKGYCSNWASNSLKATGKKFKTFPTYLNHRLLEAMPTVTITDKMNGAIQKYILSKNNPIIARIPLDVFEYPGRALIDYSFYSRLHAAPVLFSEWIQYNSFRIFRKLFNKQPFKSRTFPNYPKILSEMHSDFIQNILNQNTMITGDMFNKHELDRRIDHFCKGDLSQFNDISRLLSLELYLKNIFQSRSI